MLSPSLTLSLGPSSIAFPGTLAGSCMEGATAGVQTGHPWNMLLPQMVALPSTALALTTVTIIFSFKDLLIFAGKSHL